MTPPNQPSAEAMAAARKIQRIACENEDILSDHYLALLIDEAFAGVRRERDEAVRQRDDALNLESLTTTVNNHLTREREALREGLRSLVVECEYSASSGLPFNALGGTWTQLAKARALLSKEGK